MSTTANSDDYFCFVFGLPLLLAFLIHHFYGRQLQVFYYNFLARCYHLYALLCVTRGFILALFLSLVARDVYLAVKAKFVKTTTSQRASVPAPAESAAPRNPAPFNAQLLAWIEEDAEDAWKQRRESRDRELLKLQEERAAYWFSRGDDGEDDVSSEAR